MQLKGKTVIVIVAWLVGGLVAASQEQRPTFRAGTSRVSLNVVVKDDRGRPITDLRASDFQVFDEERQVRIDDFRTGEDAVSIALLMDTSGSMALGSRLATARQIAELLLAQYRPNDEVALFTFDKRLHEVAPFSTDLGVVRGGLARVDPWGSTSLHDAVAAAARQLGGRSSPRRAVVAITDGLDNASQLTAAAASGVASAIDVPVYVLALSRSKGPADAAEIASEPIEGGGVARLDELTAKTGGASYEVEAPAATSQAVRHILTDLRAGYLLGFTPSEVPGWHRLTVRVARKDARVRTRAGYWMTAPFAPR